MKQKIKAGIDCLKNDSAPRKGNRVRQIISLIKKYGLDEVAIMIVIVFGLIVVTSFFAKLAFSV